MTSCSPYCWDPVVLPVPGLSLLWAEGLAALDVFGLVQQDLCVLDQVVDPHGAIGCDAHHALLVDCRALFWVICERKVVHGQEESGGWTDRKSVMQLSPRHLNSLLVFRENHGWKLRTGSNLSEYIGIVCFRAYRFWCWQVFLNIARCKTMTSNSCVYTSRNL